MLFKNILDNSSNYNKRLYIARKQKNFKEIESILFEFVEVKEYIKFLFYNYKNKELEYCKLFRNGLRIDDNSRIIYNYLKLEDLKTIIDENDLNQIIDYILLKVIKRYIPFENSHISYIIRNSIIRSGKYFYSLLLRCPPRIKYTHIEYKELEINDILSISNILEYDNYLKNNWNIQLVDSKEFTKSFRISYSKYKKIRNYAKSILK